jgi:adenylate cyclase
MTPEKKLKLQNILTITVISMCFGLLYNYLFYPHALNEFIEAGSIGIIIGLVVSVVEESKLRSFLSAKSFLVATAVRTIMYSLFVSTALSLVLAIEISMVQNISYPEALMKYLIGPLFVRDFLFSFLFLVFVLFILEVTILVGKANFFRLIIGLYHQPKEISRIFMFIDLKNSTSIAEKLSNKDYSSLLKEVYSDISDAIILFGGEIYQFVGDEIVVIWNMKENDSSCVKCFLKVNEHENS